MVQMSNMVHIDNIPLGYKSELLYSQTLKKKLEIIKKYYTLHLMCIKNTL